MSFKITVYTFVGDVLFSSLGTYFKCNLLSVTNESQKLGGTLEQCSQGVTMTHYVTDIRVYVQEF